jgi:parallel beta-helix repeat protein
MAGLIIKTTLLICTLSIVVSFLILPVGAIWSMFRGDLNRTGVVIDDWTSGQVTWNFSTGGSVRSSPALSNGIVYITSYDDYVYALNGSTGAKLWSFKTGNDIYTSPVVSDGVVFIGSQDRKLYALNSTTGIEIWSEEFINGYHTSTAAVAGEVVYFGSGNGTIYALSTSDGSAIWSFRVNCNPFSCPVVVNGVVYIGAIDSSSGQMYALDATTGVKLWNFSTGTSNNMVFSSPAIVDGVVYFGADDGNVYALDAATGEKIWNYTTGALTESSPAVVNDIVYIGANNGNLYALDTASGSKIWSFSAYNCIMSSPAVFDGVVYVGSTDNNVYAVNASNGYKLWSYTTGGRVYSSPAVTKDGQVYIGSDDGNLYCINAKSVSSYNQLNIAGGTSSSGGVKQFITIYPDGSVSDPNASISREGNRYTLTGDIGGSIRVQKDNIIIDGAGHTIYGNGKTVIGGDIELNNRENVTVMDTILSGFFGTAIHLGSMDISNPQNTIGSRNCKIINNTITGGTPYYCFSIWVEGTNNSITNNHIYGNQGMGIALERGSDHQILNNLIENNGMYAIGFEYGQATVRGNQMNNNTGGAYYFTDSLYGRAPIQDIDSSNLADGKPTYYWIDQHNKAVPTDAGIVILINCSYMTVSGLHIDKAGTYNSYSIYLVDTTNSVIRDNKITAGNGIKIQENHINGSNVSVLRNYLTTGMWSGRNATIASNTFLGKGIMLGSYVSVAYNNFIDCDIAINMNGYNCIIRNNNLQNNQVAVHMFEGGNNQIYNNNFIGNIKQAEEQHSDPTRWPIDSYYTSSNNSWYQAPPVGGNYWSDYKGNDSNKDGFCDTPYQVIEDYYDRYPIVQASNTIQPTSEDLSPSETTQTSTDNINPTEEPQPTNAKSQITNIEPNKSSPSSSNPQFSWTPVIAAFIIASLVSAPVVIFFKKSKKNREL